MGGNEMYLPLTDFPKDGKRTQFKGTAVKFDLLDSPSVPTNIKTHKKKVSVFFGEYSNMNSETYVCLNNRLKVYLPANHVRQDQQNMASLAPV